jgi:hypothetical protein
MIILAASWGNEDKTAAIVRTAEVGHKAISERDTPEAWADFLAWQKSGGAVRAIEDGSAYKAEQIRKANSAALTRSAEGKLASLGISADELRAVLGLQ